MLRLSNSGKWGVLMLRVSHEQPGIGLVSQGVLTPIISERTKVNCVDVWRIAIPLDPADALPPALASAQDKDARP